MNLSLPFGADEIFITTFLALKRRLNARTPLGRSGRAASFVSTHSPPRHPLGVIAFACLFTFGTLASGLSLVSLLNPGGPLEPMWRLNPRAHEAFLRMGMWAPLLLGIVCLACAASAYGFFTGKRWGYRLGVTLLLVNLIGDIVNAALGIEPRAVVGVPIVALSLWYLSTRKVRAFFLKPEGATAAR